MNKNLKINLKKVIDFYPLWIKKIIHTSHIEWIRHKRYILKKKIDGSYDPETGHIILWDPQIQDVRDFILIISHELGHKIFQEILTPLDKKEWFVLTSLEKLDASIVESYPSKKQLEEHYCWIFSVLSYTLFLKKEGKVVKMKKLIKKIKKRYPKGTELVLKHFTKYEKDTSQHLLYHSQVVALKKWILSAIK